MTSVSGQLSQRVRAEEDRVREAYARRCTQQRDHEASWSKPYYVYARQQRERQLLVLLSRLAVPLSTVRILEVGCGTGAWLRDFVRWGVPPQNLWGVDLLPEAVAEAAERLPAGVHVECHSVTQLPFADGAFDIVLQSMLFTSLLEHEVRQLAAGEMLRVLAPTGAVLWYDFFMKNPWNRDVRQVGRREIGRLFPDCRVDLRRTLLAPPLARRIAARSRLLYELLAKVPWLCTHYLGVIQRRRRALV